MTSESGQTASFTNDKEEKLAAAKLKLKKFKKEKFQDTNTYTSKALHVDTITTPNESTFTSGRSSPNSNYSQSTNNTHVSSSQQKSPFPYTSLTDTSQFNNQTDYMKEQLQLHVQTIGILVAEKTELHSKLQQTLKKCDKSQDDNDELLGRLKGSRQKIVDLEKLVQSQHDQISQNNSNSNGFSFNSLSNSPSFDSEGQKYIDRLKSELSSMVSVNEELRLRLNESNEKFVIKEQEVCQFQRDSLDLKSQLELMNLKFMQFSNSDSTDKRVETYLVELDQQEMVKLKENNAYLEGKLIENEQTVLTQREGIKQEYQTFVKQLQQQIESLVDQINKMTDEREAAFSKLDSLEMLLNKSNQQNDLLISDLNEVKLKYDSEILISNSSKNEAKIIEPVGNKEQLLENELKYFKQQIEILIEDHNGLIKLVEEKEQDIFNLNKLMENYENDRGEHNVLLDQSHNDRQALSRALQQNKDLKKQLEELQGGFVSVTQQNLDLATRLQAEEFRQKNQDNKKVEVGTEIEEITELSGEDRTDWDDDVEENSNKSDVDLSKPSLMDSVKKRIQDLESENKDLNDYITLVNKNLEKRQSSEAKEINSTSNYSSEQEEIIDRQLKKIGDLNEKVESLEVQLNDFESLKSNIDDSIDFTNPTNFANFKLLKDKFTKVMAENADLKDKNQDLDHVVMQLQCETDTIVDYITMYQMERKKLNQKYKEKDESIRSLSTQLQINKLALSEISNYLSEFQKYTQEATLDQKLDDDDVQQKKEHLFKQMKNILDQLTNNSASTLQTVTDKIIEQNKNQNNSNTSKIVANGDKVKVNGKLIENLNGMSGQPFRSKLVVCSCCDGELFLV